MEIGAYAPDFELPSAQGDVIHLSKCLEAYKAVVVVFMCNHCPYVKAYRERLVQLQADYQDQGVLLVGINANDSKKYPEDDFDKMKTYAQEWGLNFPYLRDRTQDVAEAFGAKCTPEPFVLDQDGILRYNGQIDDSYRDPAAVTQHNLRDAIDQVLKGETVTADMSPAIGCSVKWSA
ncbi:alkyl hydroperoxide reductase/ Thiol specific antioxidant/ Mal allergen [Thalassoporum mexicanum PCC 7367]|uniref:thioredoxin family protein n=1 Tax=Thalassoporum mexicanum TaxID=3457544 RepID=UPI00029FE5EF|nr:thioredoxin family protein [Pseudanabaena sp. PCC 7367]AFY68415.1 alkyl hydroperoxide reductase/ Thiol specific antioxidant/ Mal allergen [Pseudanabaena sp. PCC 7367]